MKRPLLSALICLLALIGATVLARAGNERQWPGVEYAYVKAYLYKGGFSANKNFLIDENINPSVEKVARLTSTQAKRVGAAFFKPKPSDRFAMAMCYEPHHAFVYFDQLDRPIAMLEVCFMCRRYQSNPPSSDEMELSFDALKPILRDAGIPVEGDKAFKAYMTKCQAVLPEKSQVYQSIWDYDPRIEAGTIPVTERKWPFHKVAKVKLCEFNLMDGYKPSVHLGRVSDTITKVVELNEAQLKAVWECAARPEWEPFDEKREVKQFEHGRMIVRPRGNEQSNGGAYANGEERLVRHALICSDEKGTPIAWVDISFSDNTYVAQPKEGPASFIRFVWQLRKLRKVFEEVGIPIRTPEEYRKLADEAKAAREAK